jgi:LPXTG-motif cell wall-anchored protein
VGDEPCPGQIVVDDQCVDVTPEPEVTPTVTNDPELTPPAQLAETGVDKTVLASLALILMIAGASAIGVATRKKD